MQSDTLPSPGRSRFLHASVSLLLCLSAPALFSAEPSPSAALSPVETFPERPRPLIELGDPFLSTGGIRKGFELPTGAVWTPSFMVFGDFRTALQTFEDGATRSSEWANRLDLQAHLQLTQTERVLVGFRPIDRLGKFSGYQFEPHDTRGWQDEFRATPLTFFFEGELGQLFPSRAPGRSRDLEYGLSVGRQPLRLQNGLLLNDDSMDLFSVTRNALNPGPFSRLKLSALFAWDEIERNDNLEDRDATLFGLTGFADFDRTTVEMDALYVTSDEGGDGAYFGLGLIRRFGMINATVRLNQSIAVEEESPRVGTGTLLFTEISHEFPETHNLVYFNAFLGIDRFSSASRDPTAGGPLGRAGLLFAAVGLGRYGSPLDNHAANATGGAFGYQVFLDHARRRQLTLEAGGYFPTDSREETAIGLGLRFQQALGQRFVLVADAFGALQEENQEAYGTRFEVLMKF